MSRSIKWSAKSYRSPKGSRQVAILAEDGLARGGKKKVPDRWDATSDRELGKLRTIAERCIQKGMGAQQTAQRIRDHVRGIPYHMALDIVEQAIWLNDWNKRGRKQYDDGKYRLEQETKLAKAKKAFDHVVERKDNIHYSDLCDLIIWAEKQGVKVDYQRQESPGWQRIVYHLTVGKETVTI